MMQIFTPRHMTVRVLTIGTHLSLISEDHQFERKGTRPPIPRMTSSVDTKVVSDVVV